MGYATVQNASVVTTVSKDVHTIRTEMVNWETVNVVQTVVTTTTEYRGLSSGDADGVNVSFQHKSAAANDTTKVLGGIRITVAKSNGTGGTITRNIPIYGCRGVQQTSVKSRIADSNLFQVVQTHKLMTVEVDNPNATVTNI